MSTYFLGELEEFVMLLVDEVCMMICYNPRCALWTPLFIGLGAKLSVMH